MKVSRVGEFRLGWGESLVWDERADRLYFVDCAAHTLHWLQGAEGPLYTMKLPSMPAGLVPTDRGRLVAALDDGLHLVDADSGTTQHMTDYPEGMGGRANDACADPSGNIITGTLNLGPAQGSSWWYSPDRGWRLVDPDISNTNGPVVGRFGTATTLVIGDTATNYYSYPYEPETGAVGPRTVFGDVAALDGSPDGATLDDDGGLWCALVGGGQLARFTTGGLDRTAALPVANPTDVALGGSSLDRLFLTSIGLGVEAEDALDGTLLVIDGLGVTGRPEYRFAESPRSH